jgi:hypothetical protein
LRGDRRSIGEVHVARQQVGQIVLRVPGSAPQGLTIHVAGTSVPDAVWGAPYVVTPGSIHIEASAPGFRTFQSDVPVAAGHSVDVQVAVEPESPTAARTTPLAHNDASASPAPPSGSEANQPASTSHGRPVPVAPIAVAVAGAVVGLASIPFFVLRANAMSACPLVSGALHCPDDASLQRAQIGATWTVVADVAVGVGAAMVVTGVAWFLVGGRREQPPRRARAAIVPAPSGLFVGIEGSL